MLEPELITILEGPTPDFRSDIQLWNWGVLQGATENDVAIVEMRTNNGEDIRERCQRAWREGRKVQLDYPDKLRMRQQIDVVAMRLKEVKEGTVLKLWVYVPHDREEESVMGDDDDELSLF